MPEMFAWATLHPVAFTFLAFPVVITVCVVGAALIYVGVHWLLG